MKRRLERKVALVTGGASGLGKAISQRLSAEGARVVVSDQKVGLGRETAEELDGVFFEHDVRDEARWTEVIREVEAHQGRLDILVNNAGISGPMDALDPEHVRLSDWREVFAVNVESVLIGCRAAIPAMRRAGAGSIINICSVAGLLATPYATAYGASKATVRQLTKSVAQYCAEQKLNIRCNSVHPSDVRTPLWEKYARQTAQARGMTLDEFVAREQSTFPMGEFILPEDVAAAVCFLASDDARYMTGTKMIVDGGLINCDTFRPS